ncbi:MAG TPA: sensor histidine kinase [Verrucomicrobiae bacterium]|nr:sensor histidine kinase [Verrucomicrobiae bacterium]
MKCGFSVRDFLAAGCLTVLSVPAFATEGLGNIKSYPLEIRSMSVSGQPISLAGNRKLQLEARPRNVSFSFGSATNSKVLRIRYKLDGFDENWREVPGDMSLVVRFIDANLDQVGETTFRMAGQTEGWTGQLDTSPFVHRSQVLVVPPGAKTLWVALSSAGPPNTVGIYAVTNLVLRRLSPSNGAPAVLVRWDADAKGEVAGADWTPVAWVRSGLRPGMAKTLMVGAGHAFRALMLLDDDPTAHAEWTTRKEAGPAVSPGERLELAWDEASSIGLAGPADVSYAELPAGFYRFLINELSLTGVPGETEASLAFEVPLSIWKTPWFWGVVLLLCLSSAAGTYRYVAWQQVRRELARLENQGALEHERLRIAQDIHDDLGARVTQISLLSGLAQSDPDLPEKARREFNAISSMARDLVSALYETVWAVNPENDNLDALGNYICQMVDNLCDKAQLPRRLRLGELPRDIEVSSSARHNLILAVKESVHNVIKHARASEISVYVVMEGAVLTIRVEDNGDGFSPGARNMGNGLANMERRLKQIGGSCSVQSGPGQGTTVTFQANLVSPERRG